MNTLKFKRNLILIIFALILIVFVLFRDFANTIGIMGTIGAIAFFYLGDHLLKINFEIKHYTYIIIIAITGILFSKLYYIYPGYDKVLHFALPILISGIIFHMISKLKLELKWKLLFTFLGVIAAITLFEMTEYLLDQLLGWKLQGVFNAIDFRPIVRRIDDTMIDIALGIAGAATYWIFTYFSKRR